MTWYFYFLAVPFLFGYLLGSIPFGLLLTSAAGLGDIRKQGSGNIGATNVLRTGNKTLAAATLLLDALKGLVAVVACALIGPPCAAAAALGAVVGHNFPVWLKFRGGKGMATAIGVTLGLSWPVGVTVCVAWLAIAAAFRYSSLASLFSILIGALASWFFLPWGSALALTLVATLVWARHHQNIDRLLKGTESKIGQRSSTAAA